MLYLILFLTIICFIILCIRKHRLEHFDQKECKINIVVPIREREKELSEFINHIEKILKQRNITYILYLVEQTHENKLFNRGKLINVGFLEAEKNDFSDFYLISDVDIFPKTKNIFNIECQNEFRHLYGSSNIAGGVFTTNAEIFKKVNGFSNNYWGWGLEDDDIAHRFKLSKVPINLKYRIKRPNKDVGDLPSRPEYEKQKKKLHSNNRGFYYNCIKKYKENIKTVFEDGLTTCNYTILKKYNYHGVDNIIRILVDI